jgi:hypothetical protein
MPTNTNTIPATLIAHFLWISTENLLLRWRSHLLGGVRHVSPRAERHPAVSLGLERQQGRGRRQPLLPEDCPQGASLTSGGRPPS